MKSKIINMADKMKDSEDEFLESLLASPSIADAGFSEQVVRKVRRGLWLRRLVLPIAIAIGGLFAIKPLSGLVALAAKIPSIVPSEIVTGTADAMPQMSTLVMGGLLLAACLFGARLLED